MTIVTKTYYTPEEVLLKYPKALGKGKMDGEKYLYHHGFLIAFNKWGYPYFFNKDNVKVVRNTVEQILPHLKEAYIAIRKNATEKEFKVGDKVSPRVREGYLARCTVGTVTHVGNYTVGVSWPHVHYISCYKKDIKHA